MASDTFVSATKVGTLLSGFAAIYIVYNVGLIIYNLYFHPLAKFPGPASRAAVHASDLWLLFKGTHHENLKELHDKYGDVVRTRPDTLTFNTAQAFKDIYGTRAGKGQMQKDPRFYTVGGDDKQHIVYSSDADHARMRKLLSHAFSDSALRQQEDIMKHYFELLVSQLKAKIDTNTSTPGMAIVDMTKWYNFLTFDIIGDMCFGESFSALSSGDYHVWMATLFRGVKLARIFVVATFYQPAMMILEGVARLFPAITKARDDHDKFTRLKTAKRLDTKTDRKDFMTYILRHNDERGMSREELMETSGLLIIAGSETTATLLSGATYYLMKNPRAYAKVKEEVRSAFKQAEDITLTATAQLPYLHAVIEESLRLYPPVPLALMRLTPPEGDVVNGHFVPGNTRVAISQYATYHSAENFVEPETFVPERWLPNPPEKYRNDNRDALNPFSLGPRNCIGKNLAYNEMRSVMARMLWHFEMELSPECKNWRDHAVYFMWEKPPLDIKLTHRKF